MFIRLFSTLNPYFHFSITSSTFGSLLAGARYGVGYAYTVSDNVFVMLFYDKIIPEIFQHLGIVGKDWGIAIFLLAFFFDAFYCGLSIIKELAIFLKLLDELIRAFA